MNPETKKSQLPTVLWIVVLVCSLGALFTSAALPEHGWVWIALAAIAGAAIGGLVIHYRKALAGRSLAYGLHSFVLTLLTLSLVGVFCFVTNRYPKKLDLTKDQLFSLSEQTKKIVGEYKVPIKAVYFAEPQDRENNRILLDNFRALNSKFEIEYVDPMREMNRLVQAGIRKPNTMVLTVGAKDTQVESPDEGKILNALIKLAKDKPQTLCTIVGHGEKAIGDDQREGAGFFKRGLMDQSYLVREVNLLTDAEVAQEGKIPSSCDAIAILGPQRGMIPAEAKQIENYLANGGRALILVDFNPKGVEFTPELVPILAQWHLKVENALVVDPTSRGAQAVVIDFAKDHAIGKGMVSDRTGVQVQCHLPVARPLSIIPGAPPGLNATWVAKSMSKAWGETDFKSIAAGQVSPGPADIQPPMNLVVAAEGKLKDSKAPRNTRIVLIGTSAVVANIAIGAGFNRDLLVNSASWVLEDESVISLRDKQEERGRIVMSQQAATVIFRLTNLVMPGLIALAGFVIWWRRRRL